MEILLLRNKTDGRENRWEIDEIDQLQDQWHSHGDERKERAEMIKEEGRSLLTPKNRGREVNFGSQVGDAGHEEIEMKSDVFYRFEKEIRREDTQQQGKGYREN